MTEDTRLQELKKAILYLKRKERIKNNNDVATAMKISSSYLSQMMHGNKPFTDAFYKNFESKFNVSLDDPFTYTDLDWVTQSDDQTSAMHAPDNSNELFSSMKKLLRLKDLETENQRRIIVNQQQLIINLQKEIDVLKPLIK